MSRLGGILVAGLVLGLAVAVAACAGDEPEEAVAPSVGASAGGAVASPGAVAADVVATGVEWIDPEPPEAAALAAAVVEEAWNADKRTRLQMSITTLVGSQTEIGGGATTIAAAETSLDERLARLGAEVAGTTVTIRLSGAVLFDFDSAELRPDAEATLREVAAVLGAYGERPVRVEGHTDAIASADYNQALSERRAAAVAEWLAAHGVAAERLVTAGHGESRPVADNATAGGRQRNRRVELVVSSASDSG